MEELLGGREGGGVLVWDGEGGLRGGGTGVSREVSGLYCSYLGKVGTLP